MVDSSARHLSTVRPQPRDLDRAAHAGTSESPSRRTWVMAADAAGSELAQGGDALVVRGEGVEQPVELGELAFVLLAGDRLLDPEVGGGAGAAVHHRGVALELLERRDQAG